MINFNTSLYSNPLANLNPRVKGVDDINSKANLNKNTNSSVNSNQKANSNTNSTTNSSHFVKDKSNAVSEVLGYEVDKDGYFTEEFNKIAGIPSDYKIHSSAAQSIANVALKERAGFLNVDIAKTFGNAYKILSQVVGEDILNSKDSFTKDEIANFPQGYYYDKPNLAVKKTYSTIYDFFDAVARFDHTKGTDGMDFLFYNASVRGMDLNFKPATDILNNPTNGKEDDYLLTIDTAKDKHTKADGSITKGGLLVAVINQNKALIEGETNMNGKLNGYDRNVNGNELSLWMHSLPLTIAPMSMFDDPEIKALNDDLMKATNVDEIKAKFLTLKQRSQQKFDAQRAKEKGLEEDYKSPLMQMLENLLAFQKELAQKALKKRLDNATKVDIKA